MKVLLLCTNSDEAGAPIHVQTLILALKNRADFLAIFGEEGPVSERLRKSGLDVVVVPQMRSKNSPIKDFFAFFILSKHVKQFSPDLIHAHSSKAGMLGRLLGLRYGIPSLYTVHGWGWRGLAKFNASFVYFAEKVFSFIGNSYYLYVSRAVCRDGESLLGIAPNKGRTILNGVPNIIPEQEVEGVLSIIMPARVSLAKDHETLVRAFNLIDHDLRLVLCGAGTEEDVFLCQLKKWAPNKAHNIICLGERSDVPDLLKQAHIFALISKFEALPLSIIEAMAASKPIIATNVGGVGELISSNEMGILVERGNVEQIVNAIERLIDKDARKSIGANARKQYLKEFTSGRMVDSIFDYYQSIAKL